MFIIIKRSNVDFYLRKKWVNISKKIINGDFYKIKFNYL